LAYGLEKKGTGTVAVYDLGGGIFEIQSSTLPTGCSRSSQPTAIPF
jgi:hypothetical protein